MTARRRCVCCVLYLHAVVMRALSIEVAAMIVDAAVIQGAEAHEAVLQRVVPLLVHVVVPDYILFTSKPLQKQEGEGEGGIIQSGSATSHFIYVEAPAARCWGQLGGGESCARSGEDVFKDDCRAAY